MVNNNEEKLNKGEGQVDDKDITLSGEELEEAEVYLAEEEVAEAKEFIRDEEIKWSIRSNICNAISNAYFWNIWFSNKIIWV